MSFDIEKSISYPRLAGERVDISEDTEASLRLVRRHFRFANLFNTRGAEKLSDLYQVWDSLSVNGKLPTGITPEDVFKTDLLGNIHIVDTSSDTSRGYFFRLFGTESTFLRAKDFTGMRMGDFSIKAYSRAAQDDYATVIYSGVPRFQFIHTSINHNNSNRYRLILPLSTHGDKIDKLVVAWEYTRAQPI